MSSKVGLILSFIFVSLFFSLGIDMMSLQIIYSDLDSKGIAISYRISNHGTLDDPFIQSIESQFKVKFTCLSNCSPMFGDVVTYAISKEYKPIIIKKETMTVSIERNAVIGYYN